MSMILQTYYCQECGTLVTVTPRGRSTGCQHHPVEVRGWKDTMVSPRMDKSQEVSKEAKRAGEIKRKIEIHQEQKKFERSVGDPW